MKVCNISAGAPAIFETALTKDASLPLTPAGRSVALLGLQVETCQDFGLDGSTQGSWSTSASGCGAYITPYHAIRL